jgi:hypothetical protein
MYFFLLLLSFKLISNLIRSRRSSNFLGSIMPDSLTEALDPTLHHVLHLVVPAGVKRCSTLVFATGITLSTYFPSVAFSVLDPEIKLLSFLNLIF